MIPAPVASHWRKEFERWLEPFLTAFRHTAQQRWAPVYLKGLIEPGRRKSVEPMAERVAPGETQQLHHFVSASPWALAPLEAVLAAKADELVGGEGALLIVDDTALVKKGRHSAGVSHQYCGELGKKANCQSLVSLTLSRWEVPVCIGLRLFLPECWTDDKARRSASRIPESVRHEPKWRIALHEIDRVIATGVRFGAVTADAEYGSCGAFRSGLSQRERLWALGLLPNQRVYPATVRLRRPRNARGRPRKHPVPSVPSVSAEEMIESLGEKAFRTICWRQGTQGPLRAKFAAVRVRPADGSKIAQSRRLPGEEAWLVCEWRKSGEKRYYLSNFPPGTSRLKLARAIKGRWACEQAHQQMKQELGLDHFEGRSWLGLHHHALMVMIGMLFLQWLRLREKKRAPTAGRHPNPASPKLSRS